VDVVTFQALNNENEFDPNTDSAKLLMQLIGLQMVSLPVTPGAFQTMSSTGARELIARWPQDSNNPFGNNTFMADISRHGQSKATFVSPKTAGIVELLQILKTNHKPPSIQFCYRLLAIKLPGRSK